MLNITCTIGLPTKVESSLVCTALSYHIKETNCVQLTDEGDVLLEVYKLPINQLCNITVNLTSGISSLPVQYFITISKLSVIAPHAMHQADESSMHETCFYLHTEISALHGCQTEIVYFN